MLSYHKAVGELNEMQKLRDYLLKDTSQVILEDIAANAEISEVGLMSASSNEEIVAGKPADTAMFDKPRSPSDGKLNSDDQMEGDDATNVEQHEVVVAEKSAEVAIEDKPTPSSNCEINGIGQKEESEEMKRVCWFGMNCPLLFSVSFYPQGRKPLSMCTYSQNVGSISSMLCFILEMAYTSR